jgi:hypothetical protein
MQRTALAEQGRLDLIENAPDYVIAKRDDFAGIVRLIDLIESDQVILERLRVRREAAKAKSRPAAVADTDDEAAEA